MVFFSRSQVKNAYLANSVQRSYQSKQLCLSVSTFTLPFSRSFFFSPPSLFENPNNQSVHQSSKERSVKTSFPPKRKLVSNQRKTMRLSTIILIVVVLFTISSLTISSALSNPNSNPIRLPTTDLCPVLDPPSSCPIKCFRPDPVCGADGVTYWCGCTDAHCSRTRVVKIGFCDVDNGSVSGQALLLVHIVWLVVLGFSVLFGLI